MKVRILAAILVAVALLVTSCAQQGGIQPPQLPTPIEDGTELHAPGVTGELHTERILFPGATEEVEVTFEVIDGLAIFQGDIILGAYDAQSGFGTQGVTIDGFRWPMTSTGSVTVPFVLHADLSLKTVREINRAMEHWEGLTHVDFVPRTTHANYIRFRHGSGCSSSIGMRGGLQNINLGSNGCGVGSTIHEIGHALGMWHEQSRCDRDTFVTINFGNITPGKEGNFAKQCIGSTDIYSYDYGSIMHYGSGAFSKNGLPTIVTIPPGIPIGQRNGLSPRDLASALFMYPRHATFFNQDTSLINDVNETNDGQGKSVVTGDFDGDGYDDLAIGAPTEDIGALNAAGAVNVIFGGNGGLDGSGDQFFSQAGSVAGLEEAGDQFGFSLAACDFNNDGRDDLAIGVPFEDNGATSNSGAVNVLYGASFGLTTSANQIWDQNSSGVAGGVEAGDQFGYSLACGYFNDDNFADLAIGVNAEDIGAISNAGGVNILYGTAGGLAAAGDQFFSQATSGIAGAAEANDQFGYRLAAGDFDGDGIDDLAVGVPFEDIGALANAGGVNVIYGSTHGLSSVGDQFWSQNTTGILGVSESFDNFGRALTAGDFDDDGFDDLAVGVPFEESGSLTNSGSVNIIYGSAAVGLTATGDQTFSQANSAGAFESNDQFGYSLASGDIDGDGIDDLVAGNRGEAVGNQTFAGAVSILFGTNTGITGSGSLIWSQNTQGAPGGSEINDFFGEAVAVGDFDGSGRGDIAAGVPGEDIGANNATGSTNILYYRTGF